MGLDHHGGENHHVVAGHQLHQTYGRKDLNLNTSQEVKILSLPNMEEKVVLDL